MAREKLTDRFIKSRKKAPAGQRKDYPDALVPGLALRVTDKGHKSFVLVARYPSHPANPTRRALGDYGALTLEDARAKARKWLEWIGKGVDPRAEEARERAAAQRRQVNTFAAVAGEFLDRHVKGPSYVKLERLADALRAGEPRLAKEEAFAKVCADPKNLELVKASKREGIAKKGEAERIINGEFVKRWGVRPIADILPEEVAAAIRAIVNRGAPYQAHNALGYIRRLFNWAIGTHEFGLISSPVERLKPKDLIGARESRDRTLVDDELRTVWQAAQQLGYPYGPLVRLLILTGQREREVSDMSWSEIDFAKKLWIIPAERMKGGRAHEVPLAPEALAILKDLPRFEGDKKRGDFVFSTTGGEKPVNGFSKAKARLDGIIAKIRAEARAGKGAKAEEQDELPSWVFHDLRRSVRTHLSALPVEDLVRELVIAHAKPGLHKVYDQHAYQAEKRQCLELWEQRLRGILSPKPPADVADIEAARARRAQ